MTNKTTDAQLYAVLNEIERWAKTNKDEYRSWINADLVELNASHGINSMEVTLGGVKIGSISLVSKEGHFEAIDKEAFEAFLLEHNLATERRIVEPTKGWEQYFRASENGAMYSGYNYETGEVTELSAPFVRWVDRAPSYPKITTTKNFKAAIRSALEKTVEASLLNPPELKALPEVNHE